MICDFNHLSSIVIMAASSHISALLWIYKIKKDPSLEQKKIYDLPIDLNLVRKELIRSWIQIFHPIYLMLFCWMGYLHLSPPTVISFIYTFLLTFLTAEIWHYFSHRALHSKHLLFIHRTHHEAKVCSPFTAMSFSGLEKSIFTLGILGILSVISNIIALNFYAVVAYYVFYFHTNIIGHSNINTKPEYYTDTFWGRWFGSSTYHALHHARYVKNYGLMTQVLDKVLGTKWEDYEFIHKQVCRSPMKSIRQKGVKLANSREQIGEAAPRSA